MKAFAFAALILVGGYSAVQANEHSGNRGYIQLAQMDSPGDGLDRNAAAEGNGRPRRAYQAPKGKQSTIVKPRRLRAR